MIQQSLWYLSTALCAVVLLRLVAHRLINRTPYTSFAWMMSAMLFRDLALLLVPTDTIRYTIVWEITLPLVFVTQGFAGLGCYRAILALYPNIGRFAWYLLASCLIGSALFCFAGLPFELARLKPEPILRSLYLCYRWVDTLLAGALLLAVAFLSRFPAPLKQLPSNLKRHVALLACYFTVYTVCNFLSSLRGYTDPIRMAIVCLLYSAWTILLTRHGEETESWPQLDAETSQWIKSRCAQTEALYHQAAADLSRIGRTK